MQEKLKSWLADDALFMGMLLVLVGITSFGLGRWSIVQTNVSDQTAGVILTNLPAPKPQSQAPDEAVIGSSAVAVVASRSGSKYHLPECPGAAQIKAANKITFNSVKEAEAAGYTPAANCPGLNN